MKLHQYNEMMAFLTRPKFQNGGPVVPPEKPSSDILFKRKINNLLTGFYGTTGSKGFLVDEIQSVLDEAEKKGVLSKEDGLNFVRERKKYYDNYFADRAQKQRLRGVVEGIGTVDRKDFGGGSDMGTVADSQGKVGPGKGGYQGGGTGPVERPSVSRDDDGGGDTFINKFVKTVTPDSFSVDPSFNYYFNKNLTDNINLGLGFNPLNLVNIDDPRTPEDESTQEPFTGSISFNKGNLNAQLGIDPSGDPYAGFAYRKEFNEGSKKYDYKNPQQKNQYIMRTDEEIQAIINDPKYKDYTRKDFRNEKILTRKETERPNLKFKNFGKKKKKPENIENVKRTEKIKKTQGSNISVKGSGQTGKQFSHVYPLIESAKPGTKTTFTIDAKMNRALEGYNKIGQAIAEAQEKLILEKPDGYKKKIVELNARAKKNVMNAINDLGKEYKGQIGYFQVNPETGEFKPKAGNYKMSFAGIEGENQIYKDMSGKERKDFERKISAIEEAKKIPGVTTADKIDRPEKAKLADAFKKFGKYAKQISKPVVRAVSPFVPVLGTVGVGMGIADVAEAAKRDLTNEELGIAYLAGPDVAQKYSEFKESVRGKADETEEFVP